LDVTSGTNGLTRSKWLASHGFLTQRGRRNVTSSRGAAERPANRSRSRPQPFRRPARRVRKIDFAQLDGLRVRADQELRETEDALISFIEQQEKRDRMYVKPREELKKRFQFDRMGDVA
jgi:hypothetical protein